MGKINGVKRVEERLIGVIRTSGEKLIALIRKPEVKWSEVARGAMDAGINPVFQEIASKFFANRLTEKDENGAYVIKRPDIHTAILNGILLDELIDTKNPSPELVDILLMFDSIPFVDIREILERSQLVLDGGVIGKAIRECRPDLWSVIINIPGYGEKWLGESAEGIIKKLIKLTEVV